MCLTQLAEARITEATADYILAETDAVGVIAVLVHEHSAAWHMTGAVTGLMPPGAAEALRDLADAIEREAFKKGGEG